MIDKNMSIFEIEDYIQILFLVQRKDVDIYVTGVEEDGK